MRTNHVDKLVEAYLDDQLSLELRQQVEIHIKICPMCAQLLFDARRLNRELGAILQATLGQPLPPPMLRQKVRQTLEETQAARPFYRSWTTPARIFNAVGNAALIALLAFGVVVVTQGQIPGINLLSASSRMTLPESGDTGQLVAQITITALAPAPTPVPAAAQTPSASPRSSLVDTIDLSKTEPTPDIAVPQPTPTPLSLSFKDKKIKKPALPAIAISAEISPTATSLPWPEGTIAYALFDFTPGVEMYQIHLINPDGSNHRRYPIEGVSEPALHPSVNDYALAMRTWLGNDYPQKLLIGDGPAGRLQPITHFWEDAQPDWSPTENRIVFASQRESDRRWRLYTDWGDDSDDDKELRREGRSPTFAPDGRRIAFESCDDTGHACGLWLGDLYNSEYGSSLFLPDPSAKSPDWSPTGEEIAYMSNQDGNWELYIINSDGAHPRRLTDAPGNDGLPAWSPDGEWLAFVSDREGSWGLWLLHVSSGTLHKTRAFNEGSLTPPDSQPYNDHGQRHWWDEQISWGP